jgi:pyruvate formate lyase activating enzyme
MIAGLVPCSFIDYPGRLAAVLFLQGCNLQCPYCHNSGLIPCKGGGVYSLEDILVWLRGRVGRLTGVVISGGEPTLHPALIELITELHNIGFVVKLDTNGTHPEVLRRLLEMRLLDYVAMDLKDLPERYQDWLTMLPVGANIMNSIDLLTQSGIKHEFRTTLLRLQHDIEKLRAIQRLIPNSPWYLQRAVFATNQHSGESSYDTNEFECLVSELQCQGARNALARSASSVVQPRTSSTHGMTYGTQSASSSVTSKSNG